MSAPFRCFGKLAAIGVMATAVPRPSAGQALELRALSSRPDVVSGGDVLVLLSAPGAARWTAELDGRDVTSSFRAAERSKDMLALLTGLKLGKNVLTIRSDGLIKSTLEVKNHPSAGPVFSGAHQDPFVCQTVANGLGPALDRDCYTKTVVRYYYKSTGPAKPSAGRLTAGFKAYDLRGPRPPDVAATVTSDGRTVDYIVRRELGVINRGVYDIQFLHRPGDPLPTPWARPSAGWNGRLAFEFGYGCSTGYRQATMPDSLGAVQEPLLSKGYAIATSTLTNFANDCNDRISAETASMVKEHFIEQFGEPVHTIGWGGSGGSMQVHLIAQNYPGLLDGIIPMASFPDVPSFAQMVTDCQLLDHAFQSAGREWTEVAKTAVFGFPSWRFCALIARVRILQVADPGNCDPVVPKARVYDRVKNPKGARCDLYDNEVNGYGRDARTGFARRPLDNVGVQYGLVAFDKGMIDAEQFVVLNERIGGLDGDGRFVAARTETDEETLRLAYERGLVLTGGGALGEVPIIDWRPYSDDLGGGRDGHVRYLSFATRARLTAANGNADNQVMLVDTRAGWFEWTRYFWYPIGTLVPVMDRWLDNIAADRGEGTRAAKVVRNKPKDLEEGCTGVDGEQIAERATYDGPGRCNRMYPSYASTRIAAGGPVADDILKCALKPISAADYARPLGAAQLQRLRTVFPSGVCDFSRPGIGQVVTKATWQRF